MDIVVTLKVYSHYDGNAIFFYKYFAIPLRIASHVGMRPIFSVAIAITISHRNSIHDNIKFCHHSVNEL